MGMMAGGAAQKLLSWPQSERHRSISESVGGGTNGEICIFFTYSSETWAHMIKNPGDRTAAVRKLTNALGASVESIYWMFGPHDGIVIADAPDSLSAAALSVAVGSSGAFKHLETHELFGQEQLSQMLARAKDATEVYEPPGQQG
jgi:uncharacterized protein with GYD domain